MKKINIYKYKGYIIETCKIKYFICDPVSVTKKLRPLQAKVNYKGLDPLSWCLLSFNINLY